MAELSAGQLSALHALTSVTSSLSFLGSLAIAAAYLFVPRLRTFALSLVFYLSLADIGNELAFFLSAGGDPRPGALCTVQAVLFQFFGVAEILWTTVLARVVYTATRYPQSVLALKRNEARLHAFVWGTALVMTVLPATTGDYGPAGGWCCGRASTRL